MFLQSIFKLNDEKIKFFKLELQIVLTNKTTLGYNFQFKWRIQKGLITVVIYKFQCGLCNESKSSYGECVSHLNVRTGEHIGITGISPLTKKHVKPKNSSIADHLLFCNHSESYDDFSILTHT